MPDNQNDHIILKDGRYEFWFDPQTGDLMFSSDVGGERATMICQTSALQALVQRTIQLQHEREVLIAERNAFQALGTVYRLGSNASKALDQIAKAREMRQAFESKEW